MNSFRASEVERAAHYFGEALVGDLRARLRQLEQKVDMLERQTSAPRSQAASQSYYNQRQAAEYLGCSTEFIRRARREGTFPEPIRLGPRNLRWSEEALDRWAAERAAEQMGEGLED